MTCKIYTISQCTKNSNFLLRISSVNVTRSAGRKFTEEIYNKNLLTLGNSKPLSTTYFPSESLQRIWKIIGDDCDENNFEVYSR